jgi:putative flippase GtrA
MKRRPTLRRGSLIDRLARCMSVSILTSVLSMSVLLAMTIGLGTPAWFANVTACAIGTVPSYRLNRRWVWGKDTTSDPWREVLPFWVISFAGLVLSTAVVSVADAWAARTGAGPLARSIVLVGAEIGAYGLLWVGQFLLLDRVLFAASTSTANPKQTLRTLAPEPHTMTFMDTVLAEAIPAGSVAQEQA